MSLQLGGQAGPGRRFGKLMGVVYAPAFHRSGLRSRRGGVTWAQSSDEEGLGSCPGSKLSVFLLFNNTAIIRVLIF